MRRLVLATRNPGKVREIRAFLAGEEIEILALDSLAGEEVEETGATFEENARLKAETWSSRTSLPVLAEDSGLEVDALGGAPGVQSARYGGAGLDDAGRNRLLLASLSAVPSELRTARFRCVLTLARSGRTLATFEGAVEGRILEAPRGTGGFGYDPVFASEGRNFGELSREEKQAVSHRGKALSAFVSALRRGDARLVSAC